MIDDGPGWEMQVDNEERRRWESETLKRHRNMSEELKLEWAEFEQACERFERFMSEYARYRNH